jgi:UPF0755 protein
VIGPALFFLASLAGWFYVVLYVPVGGGRQEVRFTVSEGASAREVANDLRSRGLIRSALAFRLAAGWDDAWRAAKAGDYALRPDMSAMDMLRTIERGQVMSEWLTVPEGRAVWQVADLFQAKGLGDAAQFVRAASDAGRWTADFPLPASSLEGYLFPDTYRISCRPTAAEDLVQMMLKRFDQVVWQDMLGGQTSDRSLSDIVILASLVEGEAKLDSERPVIAAVLMNRLRQGMKLECDATVQYALGPNRKGRLTYEDLKVASPYNTYLYPGLPPGPINSPGRTSIEAALHPAVVPYLFYVARADGSHIFSRSYAEHLRAVARVRAAQSTSRPGAPATERRPAAPARGAGR